MDYLEYGGIQIAYQIEKSNRKTISIRVNHDGVIVRAPRGLSNQKIRELIQTKARWILQKYQEVSESAPVNPKRDYQDGTTFWYRGKALSLKLVQGSEYQLKENEGQVLIEGDQIVVALSDFSHGAILNLLEQWFRYEARIRIMERVQYYTARYGFGKPVSRIFIKDQKSRWGSCSSKCNLNFNYRLIMAPDEVLDYVVVHELCHLLHMNHSSAFWDAVERILPDYQRSREWLRKNGSKLSI